MLIVFLHLYTISVRIFNLMVQKKNQLDKCLYRQSEWNLTASYFLLAAWLK